MTVIDIMNNMTMDELRSLAKALDTVSAHMADYHMDNASEFCDNIIDELNDHIAYREAELEAAMYYDEPLRAGIDYPVF